MKDLFKFFKELLKKQPRGAVAIEYVLIAATIVLGSFSYLKNIENGVRNRLVGIAGSLVGFDNNANGGDINGDGDGENDAGNNGTPPPADVCTENCEYQGKICRGGKCVGCTFDGDCGGKKCDTTKGLCVDCKADSDCGAGEVCKNGSCIADPNSCNPPCAQGQICKKGGGSPKCEVDEKCEAEGNTCKATQTCFEGFCKDMPSTCADCVPEKERCENGRCVLRGTGACQSVNCGNGEYCLDGVCKKGSSCSSASDCSSGQVCAGGICAPATCIPELCRNTFVGSVCVNDSCVTGNDTNCAPGLWDPIAQECTIGCGAEDEMKKGPCIDGKFCLSGRCVPTSECKGDNTWDQVGVCKPSSCEGKWGEKAGCPDGFFCAGNVCEYGSIKCTTFSGVWDGSKCTVSCTNTDLTQGAKCPAGTFCFKGTCMDTSVCSADTWSGASWDGSKCAITCDDLGEFAKSSCPNGTFCYKGQCMDTEECKSLGDHTKWHEEFGRCAFLCENSPSGERGECPEEFFCNYDDICIPSKECGSWWHGEWVDNSSCNVSCYEAKFVWNSACFSNMFCYEGKCTDASLCSSISAKAEWYESRNECVVFCDGPFGKRSGCPEKFFCNYDGECLPQASCGEVLHGWWHNDLCQIDCNAKDLSRDNCPNNTFCYKGKCSETRICASIDRAEWYESREECVIFCKPDSGKHGTCPDNFFCNYTGECAHFQSCIDAGGSWDSKNQACAQKCDGYWGEHSNCSANYFCNGSGMCISNSECIDNNYSWDPDGGSCAKSCDGEWGWQGRCDAGFFCWHNTCMHYSVCEAPGWNIGVWDAGLEFCKETCTGTWGSLCQRGGYFCANGACMYGPTECSSFGGSWNGNTCTVPCNYDGLGKNSLGEPNWEGVQGNCPDGTFCWDGSCIDTSFCSKDGIGAGSSLTGSIYWNEVKHTCSRPGSCVGAGFGWGSGNFFCNGTSLIPKSTCSGDFGRWDDATDRCIQYCTDPWGTKGGWQEWIDGGCRDGFCLNGECLPQCAALGGTEKTGITGKTMCVMPCSYTGIIHDGDRMKWEGVQGDCPDGTFCWQGSCVDTSFCSKDGIGGWTYWDDTKKVCASQACAGASWGTKCGTNFFCNFGACVPNFTCSGDFGRWDQAKDTCVKYCAEPWGERGSCSSDSFCASGECVDNSVCSSLGGTVQNGSDGRTRCVVPCSYTGVSKDKDGRFQWEGVQGNCPDGTFCWEGSCVDTSFCSKDGIGKGDPTTGTLHWDETKHTCSGVSGVCAGASFGSGMPESNFFCNGLGLMPKSTCTGEVGRWDYTRDRCMQSCTAPWGYKGTCREGFCANEECTGLGGPSCSSFGGTEKTGSDGMMKCVVPCKGASMRLVRGACPEGTFCLIDSCVDVSECYGWGTWDGNRCFAQKCNSPWGSPDGCPSGTFCADGSCIPQSKCDSFKNEVATNVWMNNRCEQECHGIWGEQHQCMPGFFCEVGSICRYKSDCKATGQVWDEAANQCVETCVGGMWGDTCSRTTFFCADDGKCVYKSEERCTAAGGKWTPPASIRLKGTCKKICNSHWGSGEDCPDKMFCSEGTCRPFKECNDASYFWLQETHECLIKCSSPWGSNVGCLDENFFCDSGVCRYKTVCSGDVGVWDDQAKKCTQKCSGVWGTHADCVLTDQLCFDGVCRPSDFCTSSGAELIDGACVKSCDAPLGQHGDCPNGQFCGKGKCRDGLSKCPSEATWYGDRNGGSCIFPCEDAWGHWGNCHDGLFCIGGECLVCEEEGGVDISGVCVKKCTASWGNHGDCPDGHFCAQGYCKTMDDCLSTSVFHGEWNTGTQHCAVFCQASDADNKQGDYPKGKCPDGTFCDTGRCRDKSWCASMIKGTWFPETQVCSALCSGTDLSAATCPGGGFCMEGKCKRIDVCMNDFGSWNSTEKRCMRNCSTAWGSSEGCAPDLFCDGSKCRPKAECSGSVGVWDDTAKQCMQKCNGDWGSHSTCPAGQFCGNGSCLFGSVCSKSSLGLWDAATEICTMRCTGQQRWGEKGSCPSGTFCDIDKGVCEPASKCMWREGTQCRLIWEADKNRCVSQCGEECRQGSCETGLVSHAGFCVRPTSRKCPFLQASCGIVDSKTSHTCGPGRWCTTDGCVQGCGAHGERANCKAGEVCILGTCQPGCGEPGTQGACGTTGICDGRNCQMECDANLPRGGCRDPLQFCAGGVCRYSTCGVIGKLEPTGNGKALLCWRDGWVEIEPHICTPPAAAGMFGCYLPDMVGKFCDGGRGWFSYSGCTDWSECKGHCLMGSTAICRIDRDPDGGQMCRFVDPVDRTTWPTSI